MFSMVPSTPFQHNTALGLIRVTYGCFQVSSSFSHKWRNHQCGIMYSERQSRSFTFAMRKRSGLCRLLSSTVPRLGVTSFIDTTCSSTGGMLAPVPCAPTCRQRLGTFWLSHVHSSPRPEVLPGQLAKTKGVASPDLYLASSFCGKHISSGGGTLQ